MTNTPLSFSIIIARYGVDVLGGAERHARSVAERLAARGHDVRVLTSCARSYMTWANELAPGTTTEGGVIIERYPVRRGRSAGDEALKWLSSALPAISPLARAWARAQGPTLPDLLAALPEEAARRDLLVFFQLLAYPTLFGLPAVAHKSVLVPLAHQERGIDTALARQTLALPRALFVNTEPEAALIRRLVAAPIPPMRVVSVGLDEPGASSPQRAPTKIFTAPEPYLLCLGRAGKLRPLIETWRQLTAASGLPDLRVGSAQIPWRDVHLLLIGERPSRAWSLRNVVSVGYVSDDDRWPLLRGAVALVNPSLYESLSLVLLEAWSVGRPVVVNTGCDVTADLVQRSEGGVSVDFSNPAGAATAIATGLADEAQRTGFGRRGQAFVTANFVWDRVLDEYEAVARARASDSVLLAPSRS